MRKLIIAISLVFSSLCFSCNDNSTIQKQLTISEQALFLMTALLHTYQTASDSMKL